MPETREIHIKSSAQVGKTQFIASLICYLIYNDPAPILFVTANDDLVEDFSKLRLMRTLKESGLSNIVIPGSNTIHLKSFPNGFIFLTTPISEKNLISRSFKYVFCDEVSKWENQSAMSLLRSRIKTFPLAKIMTLGDPGVRDVCFMNDLYHSGDQNRYHIKCPGCSSWVPLVFKNLLFKKSKEEAKKPHYACPKCHHLITEAQKSHLLKAGKFFPSSTKASLGVRSYHLSEMISLLSNWSNVFLEWQRSKDNPLALKVFLNLVLGEAWDNELEKKGNQNLRFYLDQRISYSHEVPEGVFLLTMGVDVQANRLEAEVVGYGVEKVYGIKKYVLQGDVHYPAVWEELRSIIKKPFAHGSGRFLSVGIVFIDSGYATQVVYDFVEANREAKNVYAVKGHPKLNFPIVQQKSIIQDEEQQRGRRLPISIGTTMAKDLIYHELAKVGSPDNRYFFPLSHDYGHSYFASLFSEQKIKTVNKDNQVVYKYLKKENQANEVLDCRVYALAGFYFLGLNMRDYQKKDLLFNEKRHGEKIVTFSPYSPPDVGA